MVVTDKDKLEEAKKAAVTRARREVTHLDVKSSDGSFLAAIFGIWYYDKVNSGQPEQSHIDAVIDVLTQLGGNCISFYKSDNKIDFIKLFPY